MMGARSEQAFVGIFVIVASALIIGTVFALSGAFARAGATYHTNLPFAGGLEPGATVRYAGGPKIGRVEQLRIDPKDQSRIEITFSVQSGLPVKTDSHVRIMSLSPLGDNHLEILAGSAKAGLAPDGSFLTAEPYVDFNAITAKINDLAPDVQQLMHTLNARGEELKETIANVNDLLDAQNRANIRGALADARGMLSENRPQIKTTISNLSSASKKIEPLLDDLHKTSAEANKALDHIDSMIGENREDIRKIVVEARKSLVTIDDLTSRLDQTLDVNSENIDEILDNMRRVSQNLKEFTDLIKTRPYTLIRSNNPKEHKTGEQR
jgi:phospholipid/cholesterol/gamma-HCH transport system substrate-binding protein